MGLKTEQEKFWAGNFGDDYIERNNEEALISSNIALFCEILKHTNNIESVIEFGSNIGLNLQALKKLSSKLEISAIEINEKAVNILKKNKDFKVYHRSILDFEVDYKRDFVLIAGVLIHINPDMLQEVYQKLYDSSKKYICISVYYNPTPVEVVYRGNTGKLFKRDFAGEMLDKFPDLKLLDYGFKYHRDNNFPCDDSTWFLLEKTF